MTLSRAKRPSTPDTDSTVLHHSLTRALVAGASVVAVAGGVAASPATAAASASSGSHAAYAGQGSSLLALGSSGTRVAQVQRALGVRASGVYNRTTESAVTMFQLRRGLSADGIVGPITWGALFGVRTATQPRYVPTYRTAAQASSSGSGSSSSYSSGSGNGYRSSGSSYSGGGNGGYAIPSHIVQCESGGNYSAYNPSSGAGGAYQILPSTWRAYGGSGSPQSASRGEQDRVAAKIYAGGAGRGQWSC